jgi:AbrB family looped-hinge helix DNA binding protein
MKKLHTQMDKHGRLLIPSTIRNSLNYKPGDTFVIRAINDELRIISIRKAIKDAQDLLAKHIPDEKSLVDEFIKQRRLEVAKEDLKFNSMLNVKP